MSDRLCLVTPVYNERDAIGGVLRKWAAALDALEIDYAIRPYNDGSKDDSLAVMREVAKDLPRVDVRDKPNGGHGPTILQGYREAAADGFDWVFQIDSDDEMGPESFAELWSRRGDFDFLVGRRAGRKQALPRKIVSFVSRLAVRLFYGKSSVWDVNAPYRLMRVSAFRDVYSHIPPATFAPNVILTGMAARLRLRAFEMPVPQHDRTTGEVSIKKWKLLKAAAKSLWQTVWFARPIVPLVALIPMTVALATLNRATCMWYDELAMCDGVFMKALHGLSWSGVWACSYNPLYPMSLVAWVKLFGASHFAVCSFTVVLGYVATVVIAGIARRRNWWRGVWSNLAFVFLFWGCPLFLWILCNARVDVLVLLLTALFADALAGDENGRPRLWATFGWGAVLFLAAPYMLPLLFFFGCLMLITAKSGPIRLQVIKGGVAAGAGFAVGFLLTALYYFLQHDLIRLLGSYVYFNSITGYKPMSFWQRIACGYNYDSAALALLALAWLCGGWRRRYLKLTLFVSAIPLMMILGGRYELYYAWAFFVPALVLAVTVASQRAKRIVPLLAVVGVVLCCVNPARRIAANASALEEHARCREYIERHAELFTRDTDVVVAADLGEHAGFYYPLSERGVRIWYRGPEMLNGRTDEEKFNEGLSFIARTDEQRQSLKSLISRIQRFMPLLPESGLVVFHSDREVETVKPLFEARGYALSRINAENGFSIWRLSLSASTKHL